MAGPAPSPYRRRVRRGASAGAGVRSGPCEVRRLWEWVGGAVRRPAGPAAGSAPGLSILAVGRTSIFVTVPSSPTTSRTCANPSFLPSARLAAFSAPTIP